MQSACSVRSLSILRKSLILRIVRDVSIAAIVIAYFVLPDFATRSAWYGAACYVPLILTFAFCDQRYRAGFQGAWSWLVTTAFETLFVGFIAGSMVFLEDYLEGGLARANPSTRFAADPVTTPILVAACVVVEMVLIGLQVRQWHTRWKMCSG